MSHNKMLIDATHPEETRVVVLKDGRVEEFDYESAARKLLRGSIYLAKVTRVEPSLQAAFVDYGGNRHGFLAFNEIHPDYYQIPYADRQALIDEDLRAEADEEAEESERQEQRSRPRRRGRNEQRGRGRRRDQRPRGDGEANADGTNGEAVAEPNDAEFEANAVDVSGLLPAEPARSPDEPMAAAPAELSSEPEAHGAAPRTLAERTTADPVISRAIDETATSTASVASAPEDAPHPVGLVEDEGVEQVDADETAEDDQVESVGAADVEEEVPSRPRRRMRSYKIQEVIKRRQVVLVQVVKEERGTKGAALTTYLSLAGRYTVLMPNTGRGGGISRKITSGMDRKRLKEIADELEVPEGMGLIIRTAGAARTKQEIKRDFEYLLRLWESVRELTLSSTAPCLVYEEGDLIKRSIRDLYSKEIDEIVVAGEAAHIEARDFMSMLMPSHAKNVVRYEDAEPLFAKFRIEQQLNAMFSPYVHLRSGGYLVINQTEALVSIDINSGKSTREFSIEETALATNLEAADEIARQLRLRDLAGLIVIDFIDMEEKRNNRSVERRIKDALQFDRARIQVGRISHFGLLEMSRQRLRTGVLEGSTSQCPHCQGTGIIRSTESVALAVLRGIEDALKVGNPGRLIASTTAAVALYLLNQKRQFIVEMETRTGVAIEVLASEKLHGANFTVDRQSRAIVPGRLPAARGVVNMESGFSGETANDDDGGEEAEAAQAGESTSGEPRGEGDGRSRRRRRRGRGRGDRDGYVAANDDNGHQGDGGAEESAGARTGHGNVTEVPDTESYGDGDDSADDHGDAGEGEDAGGEAADGENGQRARRRRRGRRGGRRNREGGPALADVAAPDAPQPYVEDHTPSPYAGQRNERPSRSDAAPTSLPEHATEHRPEPRSEPRPAPQQRQAEPVAVAAPAQPAAAPVETVATPEEAPVAPVRSPRAEPVHSEPVLQRVVVGSTEQAAQPEQASESDGTQQPSRKGWWQRRLGI